MNELHSATPLVPEVGVIAVVPNRWGDQWQPRHHVLSRLARYFRVSWVNPAPEWRDVVRHPHAFRLADREPVPGFTIHSPDHWLPRVHRPHGLAQMSFRLRLQGARRALARAGCTSIILYIWHPEFADALAAVDHDLSCYHIDDEYTFSPVEQPIPPNEMRLLTECNEVFIHSPGLMAKKGSINPHTTFVPNGVDYEAFAQPVPIPPELAAIPQPRIGYTGWLKQQLDWPLLIALAERHPEWSFVLVGGQKNEAETAGPIAELSKRPNVHFLGARPTAALGAYSQHFDVCLMPYRLDDYTKYIYPLKLHEYLATGRPTVGAPIQSLHQFANVVALPSTADEWSRAISHALGAAENTPERCEERRRVAQQHDWSVLVGRIAEVMAAGLGQTVADLRESPARFELAPFMH